MSSSEIMKIIIILNAEDETKSISQSIYSQHTFEKAVVYHDKVIPWYGIKLTPYVKVYPHYSDGRLTPYGKVYRHSSDKINYY
jgi:hypothetical protein